ncbi:MAG: hypothetical protein ACI4I3_11090 [Acutalibacteraceae bacterium]
MADNFEKALKLADEIEEYYFKNPDESKLPSPPHKSHYSSFDENGQMIVENISAFWLPEFEITEQIKSVTYIVDGTYDGDEPIHKKFERILAHDFNENTEEPVDE